MAAFRDFERHFFVRGTIPRDFVVPREIFKYLGGRCAG